jgi:DNA-directed RNA polymerase subunit RPC12/RpoP
MQYLYKEQYYIDLYDLFTIKDCLEVVDTFRKIYKKSLSDKEMKDISEEDRLRSFNQLLNWQLFTTQGERYRRKSKRISEMVEEARRKQDFYDNAKEPSNIACNTCGKKLFSETKILEDYSDSPMRVLFYFSCKTCKTKRAIYNTGEERVSKPLLCPKCSHDIIL